MSTHEEQVHPKPAAVVPRWECRTFGDLEAADGALESVRTVDHVDVDRYLGEWFEIARFPNRFQRVCAGDVRATYTRHPDGSLNEAGAIIWRDGTGANYGRGDEPTGFQYEYRRETDYGSAAALTITVFTIRDLPK